MRLAKTKMRPYKSLVRERQADDTRRRIVEAARQLLQTEGYDGMTIETIARRAEVSAPSVYAIFKSKTGLLIALLDQSMFGADYEEVVRRTLSATDPETRLRRAAAVSRQIRSAQSAAFDLMRGCSREGMCTACLYASVGGHPRNTRTGLPTLWCARS